MCESIRLYATRDLLLTPEFIVVVLWTLKISEMCFDNLGITQC